MPTRKPINPRKDPTVRKGPVRHSKRVTQRVKATNRLLASIRTLKKAAAEGFDHKLADELRDGEVSPDMTLALELMGRSVKTARDALVKAEELYCRYATRRTTLDGACRHVAQSLYPEVVDVRRAVEGRFGKEAGRRVHGMEGHTRRRPKNQQPQVERLILGLNNLRALPTPVRAGPLGEREAWLAQVQPGYQSLTRVLDDLASHELREATHRDDRDFELESFDEVFREALDFAKSVYRIGGCHDRVIWHMLSTGQQRRLRGKARQEREARAEGARSRASAADSGGREPTSDD